MLKRPGTILSISLLVSSALPQWAFSQQHPALDIVKKVADKIIRDTRFALTPVAQETALGMQVIPYHPSQAPEVTYARTNVTVVNDTTIYFGLSSAGAIRIWVNNQLVLSQEQRSIAPPVEHSYGRFLFNNGFSATLKKGANELLIRYTAHPASPAVFIRPVLPNGDLNTAVKFASPLPGAVSASPWLLLGPMPDQPTTALPGEEIQNYYTIGGTPYTWHTVPQQMLSELVIPKEATYRRDAYADWNYSNGITLWSMQALSDVSHDASYATHVKKYIEFILQHRNYFEWQYKDQSAFRGSFHRLFRLTMLDDSGAPGLPIAEQYTKEKDPSLQVLLNPITDYIVNHQMRLPDGTFCRPEPVDSTVWADDLFMSTPYLLRIAKATGDKKYYDEAAAQFLHFYQYLHDPSTGLYKHGYFYATHQPSIARWGRANGWIAWATAELLTALPTNHPSYKKILAAFRQHAAALVKYQDSSGFWHQLPDRPASYEETSCTAMFTLVLARGVRKGWLPSGYKKAALQGWNAVQKNIDADGTVHGICRGTEIGTTEQFYLDRPTIDHDPRGLGAVITAGIEIAQLK